MKNMFLLVLLTSLVASCTSNESNLSEDQKIEYADYIDNPTTMEFEEYAFDFGEVVEGEMVNHTFTFENTGDQNLVLIDVKGSCGCTVPEEWPKHPLAPGETGEIKVVFNSKNRVGNALKNVKIEANTKPSITTLTISGVVKEK
ncbi:MAG: DUF1573 domain-containing protein [Crocinitomicaceae bacterium]|nr:DUF1573 domain-containing protein [Crocinitomicaceae bacterium]